MKKTLIATALAAATLGLAGPASAAVIDTVQAPTGYFVPTDAQKYSWPYYRWNGDDWDWTHNAISGPITSAWLLISAFDVDAPYENDIIWADDNGTQVQLGALAGANNIWNFTWFSLPSSLFDDIAAGLNVGIIIDSTDDGWAVTLAKSVLCVNPENAQVECMRNPNPGVPEPASLALMGLGLAGLAATRRRKAA